MSIFPCQQTVQHGFPHRASALAWDPLLRLAALGTASGALKVYGRPGVELYGQHTNPDVVVTTIQFIPGDHFTSSHNDGSFVTWEVGGGASDRPLKEPITPYGPYPCKAITKILNRTSVIDFFTTTPVPPDGAPLQEERPNTPAQILTQTVNQVAAALVVLAEEELVVIDLCDARWRPLRLPYLVSIHASAVTTMQLVDNIASNQQTENIYSEAAWPISGGEVGGEARAERRVLLTGHEDGSVRFWDVSGVAMTPLYKYTTAQLFSGEEICENNDSQTDEEEWPPFKRVGTFDPYSDDPRLAVKRVILCPLSGMLTIGGAAGHIVIASLKTTANTAEVKSVSVNIVSDRDGFVWKGHDQLTLRPGALTFPQGYQLSPPAAVTALAAQWEWGVVAAGTAHGLCALDALQARALAHKPQRRGRHADLAAQVVQEVAARPPKKPAPPAEDADIKPVERAVEARSNDDAFGSMVRCLYFAPQSSTPTLWAGTNNGTVFAFTLTVPNTNKRKDEPVTCTLAKEIQLKHRAPVIGITVLDGAAVPLPDPLEVERGVAALPEPGTHRVVITSEEQFKVFTLPSLKPHNKRAAPRVVPAVSHQPRGLPRAEPRAAAATQRRRRTEGGYQVTVAQCHVLLAPWAAELRGAPEDAPLTNGEHRESAEAAHDVTAASADITVDSVRDHTAPPPEQGNDLNINLQNSQVNTSSMVVKTTTRTAVNDSSADGDATTATTTTTTHHHHRHRKHREEGVITRIETGTVTVPAGTDPKLILEMFDRQRSPLAVPVAPAGAETN
ncbi:hypothetical protein MSG28_003949 [Choristoneura fumiferana]|uniref:Uncharacterized protein n=1 Tax=Choristoneura fumiferana TaxID=7141 RepID=A0ACC0KHL0_CHOFU|nr:hypothetical protein MSG28_003949 [Choristoneura fumiferana]